MNNAFVGVSIRGYRARKSVDPLTKIDETVVDSSKTNVISNRASYVLTLLGLSLCISGSRLTESNYSESP